MRLQRTAYGHCSSFCFRGALVFLCLHSPSSSAHLEDLKDRLLGVLTAEPHGTRDEEQGLVETLVDVVRGLDRGHLTAGDAFEVFGQHWVPGFDFGRWLAEMLDEGVYLEAVFERAA